MSATGWCSRSGTTGPASTGATVSPGVGLTNMQDRLAAVGGAVEVTSSPGAGTVVAGRIPYCSAELEVEHQTE